LEDCFGDKTDEEIAEMNELRSRLMLCETLSHYMPKVLPCMTDEDIVALKMRVLNGDLLSDDDEKICQCRSAMGREGAAEQGWLSHYLPKLFPRMTEEAVADLRSRVVNKGTLSEKGNGMISQCRSAMVRDRWLQEWQPGITDEEIDPILQNDLYDSLSSWAKRFVSTICIQTNHVDIIISPLRTV
jgi:hypothetical protein